MKKLPLKKKKLGLFLTFTFKVKYIFDMLMNSDDAYSKIFIWKTKLFPHKLLSNSITHASIILSEFYISKSITEKLFLLQYNT